MKEQSGERADNKAALNRKIAEIEQDLKQNPAPRLTTKDLAERAGLLDMYYSAYKLLSLSVHSNLRDLEQQLGLDAEGHIQTIWWGPNPHEINALLMMAADSLLRASSLMADLFQIDEQNIKDLSGRFTELAKTVLTQPDETATEHLSGLRCQADRRVHRGGGMAVRETNGDSPYARICG